MKALIIYDSVFGNTKRVAQAIGEELSAGHVTTEVLSVKETNTSEIVDFDLIVFGSPTHGGRASSDMKEFFGSIPDESLAGKKIACFDTRSDLSEENIFVRTVVRLLGYAAGRIEGTLRKKGGEPVIEPEGFLVSGREGPLVEGELERAKKWGRDLAEALG